MKVTEVLKALEALAPTAYQESYDNCGLQTGDPDAMVTGILLCVDVTEAVVTEAMERGCNLVVAHHPLIFSGLKRITGSTYVERTLRLAIKNDVSIIAVHTNLDNQLKGVNDKIAQKLGLTNCKVLAPMPDTLVKLYTYVPIAAADKVRDALFTAGAGVISDYSECSFNTEGTGTFRPGPGTNPTIGVAGGERKAVNEVKIEVLLEKNAEGRVLQALRASHPYEEVAYELIALRNVNQNIGAGLFGDLATPMPEQNFLKLVKENLKTACIRHTTLRGKSIEKVALCGGSGSFLLRDAIKAGADVFITGDFKYHQFFDADGRIVIADIGHFESEQFTPEIFRDFLTKKFPNFAILLSGINTNPLQYFC